MSIGVTEPSWYSAGSADGCGWKPSFPVLQYGKKIFSQPGARTALRKVPWSKFPVFENVLRIQKVENHLSFFLPFLMPVVFLNEHAGLLPHMPWLRHPLASGLPLGSCPGLSPGICFQASFLPGRLYGLILDLPWVRLTVFGNGRDCI